MTTPSPKKPRTRGSHAERMAQGKEMRGKYETGRSIRSLCREYELPYGTVRNRLTLARTTLRKRGGGKPRPPQATDNT